MRQCFFIFFIVFVLSCSCNTKESNKDVVYKEACSCADIYKIMINNVSNSFFTQLDSIKSIQLDDDSIFYVDLNRKILLKFINDIDIEKYVNTNMFSKEYNDLLKKGRHVKIELEYYPQENAFRISVTNEYIANDFSGESTISYSFQIKGVAIYNLKRNASG
jgi:hypothetical protein